MLREKNDMRNCPHCGVDIEPGWELWDGPVAYHQDCYTEIEDDALYRKDVREAA